MDGRCTPYTGVLKLELERDRQWRPRWHIGLPSCCNRRHFGADQPFFLQPELNGVTHEMLSRGLVRAWLWTLKNEWDKVLHLPILRCVRLYS